MELEKDGVVVKIEPVLTFFRPIEPRKETDGLLTSQEAADYLRVHVDTLRKWTRLGKVPRVPLPGSGKDFRFRKESLNEWAKGRELR